MPVADTCATVLAKILLLRTGISWFEAVGFVGALAGEAGFHVVGTEVLGEKRVGVGSQTSGIFGAWHLLTQILSIFETVFSWKIFTKAVLSL